MAVAAAWVLLGTARLLTLALPSTVVRHLLGERRSPSATGPDPGRVPSPPGPSGTGRARQIGWVVRTAAARTPWTSDCFPQALTARVLLRAARVPHVVTFGVRRDDTGALKAHVRVAAGEVAVTGGSGSSWTGVGSHAWAPRRP
ncbi:lasso peptide biosynthesis B2 protein [Nocardioides aromaticivorans]|uniref:lasso peptide biosynthesis B2 protein n=1 Tax=Nocardioides aromaticivorans TaxID=200618 RepID=UPI002413FD5C|nr:lasso peptide biosynthesis B2 protein [Nocardioides aromaticivorans]